MSQNSSQSSEQNSTEIDDSPIVNLLNQGFENMSIADQQDYIKTLRDVSTNSHAMKKMLTNKSKPEKKTKAAGPKTTVKSLLNKYM